MPVSEFVFILFGDRRRRRNSKSKVKKIITCNNQARYRNEFAPTTVNYTAISKVHPRKMKAQCDPLWVTLSVPRVQKLNFLCNCINDTILALLSNIRNVHVCHVTYF